MTDPSTAYRCAPKMWRVIALFVGAILLGTGRPAPAQIGGNDRLPDGSTFVSWEQKEQWTRTYHVAQEQDGASDANPGTVDRPWKTIQKAAETLLPGERVLIHAGTYREWVSPQRGGDDANTMIGYQAAPGDKVIIKGSDLWKPTWKQIASQVGNGIWKAELPEAARHGASFSMPNFLRLDAWKQPGSEYEEYYKTKEWVFHPENEQGYALRRGQLFLGGKPLTQVLTYEDLLAAENVFWVEGDHTLAIRLAAEESPQGKTFEITVRPQVFAPRRKFLDYLRISGLTLLHAANGVPSPDPQRGLVSAMLGHHWIIEDCEIGYANTIGADIGGQKWELNEGRMLGCHIVRRCHFHNCGINALDAWHAGANQQLLIEQNLFEKNGALPLHEHLETAAVKLHRVTSSLFRKNIFRHNSHGPALWLDGECTNSRVTQNLIYDTKSSGFGAIFIEINHGPNLIDNNIILNTDIHGIYSTDAARIIVIQNLIANSAKGSAIHIFRAGRWRFGNRIPWEDESWIAANIFVDVDRYVQLPNLTSRSDFNVLGGQPQDAGKAFGLFSEYRTANNGDYDLAQWRDLGLDVHSVAPPLRVHFNESSLELAVEAPPDFIPQAAKVGKWDRLPSMAFVFELIQEDFLGRTRTQPVPKDDAQEMIGLPRPRAMDMGPLWGMNFDGEPLKIDPRH